MCVCPVKYAVNLTGTALFIPWAYSSANSGEIRRIFHGASFGTKEKQKDGITFESE
jgi:hypothetical protein